MADDSGPEPEYEAVLIPLSLIRALSAGLLTALEEWQEERGIEQMDADRCVVAMIASVEAAMEVVSYKAPKETLQ